jgi:RNA polymerase sigma factor (sigma-70 family)
LRRRLGRTARSVSPFQRWGRENESKPNKIFFEIFAPRSARRCRFDLEEASHENNCLPKGAHLISNPGMDDLIHLIEEYRRATTLEDELRIMDAIITWVSPKVELYLLRACSPDIADDVLQETLLKIFKKLRSFRGGTTAKALAWCYAIARNELRNHFRTNRIGEHLDPFDMETMWKMVEETEKSQPLSAAHRLDLAYSLNLLYKVKRPCRGYLWSYYVRGMDYKEIAAEYGLKYDTARIDVKRCLELAISLVE